MATRQAVVQDLTSGASTETIFDGKYDYAFLASYDKDDIANSLKICCGILESLNIITGPAKEPVSEKSIAIGEKMAKAIIEVLKEMDFHEQEELFFCNEDIPGEDKENIVPGAVSSASSASSTSSDNEIDMDVEYEPDSKAIKSDYIPLDTKIKIVNLVREHPKWSLKTIRRNGGSSLDSKSHIYCCEHPIDGNPWPAGAREEGKSTARRGRSERSPVKLSLRSLVPNAIAFGRAGRTVIY